MSRLFAFLVYANFILAAGCASPIPLNNVAYSGTVSVATKKAAVVNVISGAVHGTGSTSLVPIGTIFVPITSGPHPRSQFNVEDQRAFAESIRSELVRIGLFSSATSLENANGSADILVNIIFPQTFHNPNWQEYTLDVVMELLGGKEPFLKQYRVVSSEKDSLWEKMNTNAYEGKEKAVKLLLEKLIPDIEAYLEANPGTPQPPAKIEWAL